MCFRVAGARGLQKWAKREGFVACPKQWQAWGIWRGSVKMHFPWQAQYKRHVHQRCSEVRAPDFLRGVAFWSMRSSSLLRWFCVTGATLYGPGFTFSWQAQCFRGMEWKNRKTHWYQGYQAVSSSELLCLWSYQVQKLREEVSHNCFVFGVGSQTEEMSQNN